MADEIRDSHPDAAITLVEGSGGVFEVTVDGTLIFSKAGLGRHAEPGEVLDLIRRRADE